MSVPLIGDKLRRCLVVLGFISCGASPSHSADAEWVSCNANGAPDRIASCKAILQRKNGETTNNLAIAHNNLANAYLASDEYDTAISEYTEAIEIDSLEASYFYNRGVALAKKGSHRGGSYGDRAATDYGNAIEDFSRAIELDNSKKEYFFNKGLAYFELAKFDEAISEFSHAIKIDSEFALAYSGRAVAYTQKLWLDQKDPGSKISGYALADYEIASKLDFSDSVVYNNLGFHHQLIKNYTQSIDALRKAVRRDASHLVALGNMLNTYLASGNNELYEKTQREWYSLINKLRDEQTFDESTLPGTPRNSRHRNTFGVLPPDFIDVASLEGVSRAPMTEPEASHQPSFNPEENRVALLIGNSAYASIGPLKNPTNDTALMAETLRSVGFDVTVVNDADLASMKRAMLDFGRKLRGSTDVGLFYYSGHGVNAQGRNFLIPVDASVQSEDEVALESVDLNDFLRTMESSASRVNIVILDACRNNPFQSSFRSASRGLTMVAAPTGTYVAFSTAPGEVAEDGDGANSTYTKALAEAIRKPGLPLEGTFKEVRRLVRQATRERQVTWDSSSIEGDFYFQPAK